ncbi:MAG TPA: helix-turn-helix domain-containing protein [Thermoleophilia bacterium]|nr:helix-turn-helix domain-containing protein [Thermoleophilia bacterium]
MHTISDAGALTVRELLEHSGLGLTAATGEVGLGRVVKGIHFSDADDPVRYLTSESVLVATGRTWYQDVSAGLYQLDRLASIDTAALVVALGHFVDEIPAEMVARARELRLPVLLLPAGSLTRTVLSYVYHALASADLHRLRRTVAMQNDLLDLLIAEAGVDELLAKVSLLIGMPMLLLDGTGTLVTSMGEVDPHRRAREVWEHWAELTDASALGIVEVGDSRFFCRDVLLYGKLERLIVAAASQTSSSEFVDMALSFLQRLITLDLLKRRDEIVATRRLRRRLLRDLLTGSGALDELTALVAEHGVDLQKPWRVALCDFGGWPRGGRRADELEDALVEAVDTFCGDRLIALLSRPKDTSLAVLLPDGYPSVGDGGARDLARGIKTFAAGEPYRLQLAVGLSGAHRGPVAGPQALQEAIDALGAAQRGIDAQGLVLFEELSGRFRLLQGQSGGALADIARRSVAPLLEYDARRHTHLLDTLRTLLDNHFAIQPTAEALFIHRNTLQKRMRRIETLLGVDLADIDDLMELYLGLRALQLVGEAKVLERGQPLRLRPRPALTPPA